VALNLWQHKGSLAMVALAVGFGAYLVVDQGKITDTERQDRQHDVFPAYRRADIDFIELVQAGGEKLRIERRVEARDAREPGDSYWEMTSPVDERADPASVDRFVGDLEFAGAVRKVDKGATDQSLGFDAPRVRGTLAMKSLVYRFALGGPAPVPEGAAYFRVEGEGTFVVSKDFAASVMNGAATYRDRTIVPYLSLDLSGLALTTAAGSVELSRVDDTSFKLKSGLRASREVLDRVWGALAEARASSFLADADADRAVGPTPIRVVMTPKDPAKPKGELLLGGTCPGHADDTVLIRLSPRRESACVPKGALPGLSTPESDLVDRHLFASRPDETEELVLETVAPAPPYAVELARKGKGWHERKPADRELGSSEVELVNELVNKLTRGEGTRVSLPDAATPFAARARARLKRGGSSAEEVVELAGTDRVRRAFDGAILEVPASLGRRLWPSETVLRGRAVFPGAAVGSDGEPTALATACDGVVQSLTRAPGAGAGADKANKNAAWVLHEPAGLSADPLTTADVVALVRNAQVESWVSDRDDGTFGLTSEPSCKVDLSLATAEAGSRVLTIQFGKEAEGGYYARASTGDAVFVASRALREAATTWLIDRSVFRADRQAIERVTLSRGASHVSFPGPAASAARPGAPAAEEAGHDMASVVLETIESLRPEFVIHLGPARPTEGFATPALDVRVKLARAGAGAKEAPDLHFVVGDSALINRERVVYMRRDGVEATYAAAHERVQVLLDAL
jgi:hypothetical protein